MAGAPGAPCYNFWPSGSEILPFTMTFLRNHTRCLWTLLLFVSVSVQAADVLIPGPPKLAAKAFLLMDADSGEVIAEENADERLEPASLTKMMTAYVASHELSAGNISLQDKVRVSEKAWKMGGSRMFLRVGTEVTVGELLHGIIIQSGNDASVAIAEHIAGAEDAFVQIMNHHAQELGMHATQFRNSHGWPAEGHLTTARDMATLARAIIQRYPEHYAIYKIREYTYNGIRQPNRNKLLWDDPSVDGLKTGHTEAAGYCLVASAVKGEMRLISVVMGASGESARARQSRKLLAYGFRYFESLRAYAGGEVLNEPRVWGGAVDQFPVGLAEDLLLTIPRGRQSDLQATLEIAEKITAPISENQELGTLRVRIDDRVLAERPLVALASVEQGGLFKRLWDWMKLFFLNLFEMI